MQIVTIFGDVEVQLKTAIFLPASKIIRWKLFPGNVKWYAYRGETTLPKELQTEAFMFSFSEIPMFKNSNQIFEFILQNKGQAKSLPSELTSSLLARKIKNHLDQDFEDLKNSKLSEMAMILGVKPNEMSQSFKKCYGMNPVEYKNRLKLNKALYKIWLEMDSSITDACYESGFDEYSSFYRNFIKWLNVEPSYFSENAFDI